MKTYAFIDSQNLNLGVRSLGWKLDFSRFRKYLEDKYKTERAFLFIGYIPDNKPLYKYLQEVGYTVIFKPTVKGKKEGNSSTKGNVDAELVLHTMIEYSNYDKAIIVSGDGDFYCLVEHLDQKDKLLKVMVPNKKYSSLLRRFRKYIVHIADFKAKVQDTKKRGINLRTKP